MNFGYKIKKIRKQNKLTQSQLANIFYVSEKTISSWENNRTVPDLQMIYKISNYFKISFYYFIDELLMNHRNFENQLKLKVDNQEYKRILDLVSKMNDNSNKINQIDRYYKTNQTNEWLRIRTEDGRNILNYKKQIGKNKSQIYNVNVDDEYSLSNILENLGFKLIGTISKERIKYSFKTFDILFDNVSNIGYFIEFKNYTNKLSDEQNLFKNILLKLNINLKYATDKKYVEFL